MSNKYTLSQVEDIIDEHLELSNNFLFVCDFALAHYIYDYLHNDYGIDAKSLSLDSDVDEYYVSVSFYKDEDMTLFCEFAKNKSGIYKFDEVDNMNYYIFVSDMYSEIAQDKLCGDKSVLSWCELIDEALVTEEPDELCRCPECVARRKDELESQQEYVEDQFCDRCKCDESENCNDYECTCGNDKYEDDDEKYQECTCPDCVEERKVIFISEAIKIIQEEMCRPQCLYELLESVYDKGCEDGFYEGYEEAKEEMREFLED